MKENQQQKCHVCRFCKQSFSNGKKLGGHMRCHLALISACRKMGTQQKVQEAINGEKGVDVCDDDDDDQMIKKSGGEKQSIQENNQDDDNDDDDVMIKKSQHEVGVDQDYRANVYVLRENPKRSWRVSNSSKDCGNFCKKRCDSRKDSMKQSVCEKCGKSFNSVKALYGHMRCHSIRRSQPFDESSVMLSTEEHDDDDDDDEVATPVRKKKRSCTRYKSPKHNHHCTSLSSDDDEVENGAICLMMLSRGVRNLDEVKLVISKQAKLVTHQSNVEFEVSVDESMEFWKLKNKSKLGLKKDLIFESGSGQLNTGRAGSRPVKYNSSKRPRFYDQDVHKLVNPDIDFLREVPTMVLWGPQ